MDWFEYTGHTRMPVDEFLASMQRLDDAEDLSDMRLELLRHDPSTGLEAE